jgi:hypothetical protein
MTEEAPVSKVDRLVIRVDDPQPLFHTFTRQMLLPQAWPVTTNPFFTSGGIHLGNLNLEILSAGKGHHPTRLFGIAFQLAPYEHSLPVLEQRGIPHTPPQPFYQVDDQGWQVTAWTNVILGGLLGDTPLSRLFINLSHHAPEKTWENGSLPTPLNRRFGLPFLLDRVFHRGMTYAVDYNPAWYALHIHEEPLSAGLEVKGVYEVCIGAQNFVRAHRCWQALLQPHPEIHPGIWQLPGDLHLRLVPAAYDGLRGMTIQVQSLNRALQFLNKRDLITSEKNGSARISRKKMHGLDIHLVQ